MPFLYEKIDTLREVGVSKELPKYISENLNPNFELRPYQKNAFENFITYFESDKLCQKPTQTLFHMATGSGKTLIMAGLMLYLYKQGYRNFLFFVNLSNIVQKTKENFLNNGSSKYLFSEEITIDGEKVPIKEVTNFQYCDNNAINICFTTTQGLHSDMWGVKENALSIDDFVNQKIVLIMDDNSSHDNNPDTFTYRTTIGKIADINYAIVYKALCKYSIFKFNILKSYFPNLKSTKEFIYEKNYLGNIKIHIISKYKIPNTDVLYNACLKVLGNIAESISGIEETYEGSKDFTVRYIHDVFKDKRCNYIDPHDGGIGVSQNDSSVPIAWKMDLSKEDWFAFEDNYGTSEEKAFVAYFKTYIDDLKDKYDKVYLVRNERQLAIYSFDGGERFEPDYLLFLHTQKNDSYEQLQVFIEPKGAHLIDKDRWKEDFLLQLESKAIPVTKFADDNKYKIWGFHFFNRDERSVEFDNDMIKL